MGKRFTMMVDGPCQAKHCFNRGRRCGGGLCPSCCHAFHDHGDRSPRKTGDPVSATNISTAVQPTPPQQYEPGSIQLVLTQDITPARH